MKIIFHRGALKDMAAIRKYIARDDPGAAARVIARIERTANYLVQSPYLGRPGPDGIRLLSVARLPYVVVHKVRGDTVSVVAVFHTSRNRAF